MPSSRLFTVALAIASFVVVLFARHARADPPGPRAYPVYVLAIDTDDVEDQAEALTGALRSRVRSASGWSLSDTTVTLSMLTAALKCPRYPDPPCLSRIAEQLKADRFIWGTMQKAPGNNVKVDLHLWQRNKPEAHAGETYSENLKDQYDERLGHIAQRLFDRLTGSVSLGTLSVHAGDGAGVVIVDGQRRALLDGGAASIELPAGNHALEVRVQGFQPSRETVSVTAGRETRTNVTLAPVASNAPDGASSQGPNGRKIGGWAAIGIGGALIAGGAVEAIIWANKSAQQKDYLANVPRGVGNACDLQTSNAAAAQACSNNDSAKKASAVGWALGGAGALAGIIGLYLVLTEPAPTHGAPKFEDRAALRVTPAVGPTSQGVLVEGAF